MASLIETYGLLIATVGLFIATLSLVVVTYFHMRHGKRLADSVESVTHVMIREFEIRISPLVDVQMGTLTGAGRFPNTVLTASVIVRNIGSRPCYVKNAKFVCSLRGQPEQHVEQVIKSLSSETLLPPNFLDNYRVEIKGQSWMSDRPPNYVFSCEMEVAGEDRKYQSSRIEFSKFP